MANRKVNITNFREYIKQKKKFYIALYQRKFVWTNEKIDDFLNEVLESVIQGGGNRIFGGTFYLKANIEKGWEIIDGQQRTTFLFGVTKYIEKILPKLIEDISYLKGLDADKFKPLLSDLKNDISSFTIELERVDFNTEITHKGRRTYKAFKHIESELSEIFASSLSNAPLDVAKYILAFYDNIDFIEIDINDSYDLHDIFKTINSRNERLTDWDIIRNDMYKRLDGEKSEKLKFIDESLNEIEKKLFIKKEEFIQAYLTMRTKTIVNKNKLSASFDELKDENITEEIYDFIESFIKSYNEIEDLVALKPEINNNLKVFFSIIREMNTVQVRNISLAIIMSIYFKELSIWKNNLSSLPEGSPIPKKPKLKNSVPNQLKRLFINFVLNINILDERANSFNTYFISENSKNIKSILEDYNNLDEVIEKSPFFKFNKENIETNKFIEGAITEKKLIKFLIWLETSDSNVDCLNNVFSSEYEHVMPQNLSKWKKEYSWVNNLTEDDEATLVNNIGNIILLNKKMNVTASNNSFEIKKQIYFDESNTRKIITKTIPNNEDMTIFNVLFDIENESNWNDELINERSKIILNILRHSLKERIESPENKSLMDYILESISELQTFKVNEIYQPIIDKYTQDKVFENYATMDNFKAKIRQTIQYYTLDGPNNKYESKFKKEIDGYKII